MLLPLALAAGVATLAIHITGARGPALPFTGLPVVGGGLYNDVWPLDTTAHFLAGVSLGSGAYAALSAFTTLSAWSHGLALVIIAIIGILWEAYEVIYWGERESKPSVRRWFEDTQADMVAVLFGTSLVGLALETGVL